MNALRKMSTAVFTNLRIWGRKRRERFKEDCLEEDNEAITSFWSARIKGWVWQKEARIYEELIASG